MKQIILFITLFSSLYLAACASQPERISTATDRAGAAADSEAARQARQTASEGSRMLARGNIRGALAKAEESVIIEPTFDGYYLKGLALSRLGRADEAKEALESAEKLEPSHEQLLLTLAMIYTAEESYEKAQEKYLKLRKEHPDDLVYAYRVGVGYKLLKDYEKAYEALKKSDQDGFRYRDQTLLQLGDVALELKKFDEAEQYFARAKKQNPRLHDAQSGRQASATGRWLDQGNTALKNKDYAGAKSAFTEAVKLSPESAAPRMLLATALISLEEYPAAEAQLQKAVNLDPKSPKARVLLADVYRKQNKFAAAEKTLEDAIRDGATADLHNQLGLYYRDTGEIQKSLASFKKATTMDPKYFPAWINQFFALVDTRQYTDARASLNEAKKLKPDDPRVKEADEFLSVASALSEGDLHFSQNRFGSALKAYEKALKIKKHPIVYNSIASAELARNRLNSAAANFKNALSLDKNNIQALEGLLRVYTRSGNRSARNGILNRVNALSKENPEAALAIGKLFEEEDRLQQALNHYKQMQRVHGNNPVYNSRIAAVYHKMAVQYNDRGDFNSALSLVKRAKQADPDVAGLAETEKIIEDNRKHRRYIPELKEAERSFQRADYSKAEQQYRALYAKWKRPAFLVRIAESVIRQGKEAEGFGILEEAMAKQPEEIEIRESMYAQLMNAGKEDEAKKGFLSIVKKNENAYYSHYKLGVLHLMEEEDQKALDRFELALIYRPDFLPARLARGVAFYKNENFDRAKEDFKDSLKYDTFGKDMAQLNLALMDFNENRVEKAKQSFEEITKLYPEFPDAHYHLSFVYFDRGRLNDAEKSMRKAIDLKNDPEYTLALLKILEKKMQATPAAKRDYRETALAFVRQYPNHEKSADIRDALRRLTSDQRILSEGPSVLKRPDRVFQVGHFVVSQSGSQIQAVRSGEEVPRYNLRYRKIQDIIPGRWMVVLADGYVRWIDTMLGDEIRKVKAPAGACSLTGSHSNTGVLSGCEKDSQTLTRMDETRAQATGQFLFAGAFFRWKSGKLIRLDENLKDTDTEISFARGPAPEAVRAGDYTYVMRKDKGFLVFDKNGKEAGSSDETFSSAGSDGQNFYLISGMKIGVVESGSDSVDWVSVRYTPEKADSVKKLNDGNILYTSKGNKIRLVNTEGKVLWTADADRYKGRMLSVYY